MLRLGARRSQLLKSQLGAITDAFPIGQVSALSQQFRRVSDYFLRPFPPPKRRGRIGSGDRCARAPTRVIIARLTWSGNRTITSFPPSGHD